MSPRRCRSFTTSRLSPADTKRAWVSVGGLYLGSYVTACRKTPITAPQSWNGSRVVSVSLWSGFWNMMMVPAMMKAAEHTKQKPATQHARASSSPLSLATTMAGSSTPPPFPTE
jgi:hypothetical protein